MYNFQRQFDLAQAKLRQEGGEKEKNIASCRNVGSTLVVGKEVNGNLNNTLEAIVLTNDPKAHSNSILTQIIVRPEANCDLNHGQNNRIHHHNLAPKQGFDNQAFQTDELATNKSNMNNDNNNNTHL